MLSLLCNNWALLTEAGKQPLPRGSPRLTQNEKKNQIGTRVRERRLFLGLTQDALCARLATVTDGVMDAAWIADDQEISKIENGNRTATDFEILALAGALDCNACWLLMGKGEMAER